MNGPRTAGTGTADRVLARPAGGRSPGKGSVITNPSSGWDTAGGREG